MSGRDLERLRVGLQRTGVAGQAADEAILPTNDGPRMEQVEKISFDDHLKVLLLPNNIIKNCV